MRRNFVLLLSTAVLVSSQGCIMVGGGLAHNWSAPAPIAEPDRYTGWDVSIMPLDAPPVIASYYSMSDGDQSFIAPYVTYDLGIACFDPDHGWWPVLKPVIGIYHWSESAEETGLLTGVKVGAGVLFGDAVVVTFEYGWLKAHDAIGDHDARLQTATAGILLSFLLGPQY